MIYVLIGLGIVGLLLIVWCVPKCQAKLNKSIKPEERWEAENEFRKTIIQIVGGIVIIAGLYITWTELDQSREQLRQSREQLRQSHDEFQQSQDTVKAGQISSRFSQAITLLSEKDPTTKIGAIYALEQIAKESPNYLQTVLDILTSFIKDSEYFYQPGIEEEDKKTITAKFKEEIENININSTMSLEEKDCELEKILIKKDILSEVQVALNVIGRIRYEVVKEILLQEKTRERARVEKRDDAIKISEKEVEEKVSRYRINLVKAILINAALHEANFQDADLLLTYLNGTTLFRANLQGANLADANLQLANFEEADLRWANLTGAKGITVDMLLKVKSLHGVEGLDPKIEEELRRRKPELFEKPKSD